MIVTTRTLTCNFCYEWVAIDDGETGRDARRRVQPRGWRTFPDPHDRRRVLDACPLHPQAKS